MEGVQPVLVPPVQTANGKLGYYPKSKGCPVDLYQTLVLVREHERGNQAKRLNMETDNGRLAMIGLTSLFSEAFLSGPKEFGGVLPPCH